jgi:hypothetical protein
VDADRFERLVAAGAVTDAMRLWRGPALAEFAAADFARGPAVRLTERFLSTVEQNATTVAELAALGDQGFGEAYQRGLDHHEPDDVTRRTVRSDA